MTTLPRLFVSLTILVGLLTIPASFAPDGVGKAESHCVMFVVGQHPDGEFILSDPVCFADEKSAALWAAYGAPESYSSAPGVSGYAASSTFTLGRHYDGFNGTGSSIQIVGSSCTGGYWNTSSSWDNRISSSYNGCATLKHWDLPNITGSVEYTSGSGTTDNLTYMNNRTESVSYH